MTDQEINVAVAEGCGWTSRVNADGDLSEAHLTRTWIEWLGPNGQQDSEPPNYCADLNAMHEAEMWLIKEFNRQLLFGQHLRWLCADKNAWHATARQRAEAFLKTLGKWRKSTMDQVNAALSTDAGKGYVPADKARCIAEALRKSYEFISAVETFYGRMPAWIMAGGPSLIPQLEADLATARELGLLEEK